MSDLVFARSQMAMSLGFHIVFAALGIGLPLLMVIAEWRWIRTGDRVYLELAKRWAKGTAILFAVGAVSGTVLSFELGLLFPELMDFAGAAIGMPFSLEGFAFFTEAIFLGIYLYGWDRVGRVAHLLSGVVVAVSGAASALFVTLVNAWMNVPVAFRAEGGRIVEVDVWGAMLSPAAAHEVPHVLVSCYVATGFAAAGVHAFYLRRDPKDAFHRKGLAIALALGAVTAPLAALTGDLAAKGVADLQPAKLAAMEGLFEDEVGAPLSIGGWPDEETRTTSFKIELPGLLSYLAYGDFDAEVIGLSSFPEDEWPPVLPVHLAFQVMVGCGFLLLGLSLWALVAAIRRKLDSPRLLRALVWASPLGFIAMEAGWIVTEVGRQPWVIYGVLRTAESVTPMPGLVVPFITFTVVYLLLAVAVVVLLRHQFRKAAPGERHG